MKNNRKVASLSPATQNNVAQKVVYTCQQVFDELVSVFGDDQVEDEASFYNGVFIPYDRTDTLRPYQMQKQGFDNLLYSFSGSQSKHYNANFAHVGRVWTTNPIRFYGSFLIFASYDQNKKDPVVNFVHSNMSGFGRVLMKNASNIRVRSYESVFDGYGASTTVRGNLALGTSVVKPYIILYSNTNYLRLGYLDSSYFQNGDDWGSSL